VPLGMFVYRYRRFEKASYLHPQCSRTFSSQYDITCLWYPTKRHVVRLTLNLKIT